MPTITGVVGTGFGPPDAVLRSMMGALARHEVDGARTETVGPAHFGIQLRHTLPEDDFDRQPHQAGGGRFLIVADARVDNREEMGALLGISGQDLRAMCDTDLLARGWERWKLGLFDWLLGDIALAVWDNVEGELTLVRSPLSSRPTFFSESANSIAFASFPFALCAVPLIGRLPDLDELSRFLAGGLFQATMSSFFQGIRAVPQGKAIVLKAGTLRLRSLWSPGAKPQSISTDEAGDLIRHELDRATRAQARRRSGPLAAMLSSGRDSSAVLASAAQFEGSQILALTAAPRSVVDGLPSPWIADESEIASHTAERLFVEQLTCRTERPDLCALLDEVSASHFQPFNNPVNLPWISQISRAARQNGATVMMTGAAGNFTISLGGPSFLPDYWRKHGWRRWLRVARGVRERSELSWQQIAAHSLGSFVPAGPYGWLRRAAGRDEFRRELPLLQAPFRNRAETHAERRHAELRPRPSRRAQLSGLLQGIEPGDKYSLACWGVDIRDPTADRRLAEACLSLPVEALVGPDKARPAYQHAFGDLVPEEVVAGRHSGAQSADWFETIRPQEVLRGYRRYAGNSIVKELFDLKAVESMIERWPRSGAAADALYDEYCNQLLGGLAVASFVNTHFAG